MLGRSAGTWLLCAVLFGVLAGPLKGQEPELRDGFWWGLGLGYGWVHVACDICDSDRSTSISGTIHAGGTVSRQVRLGAEANGWTNGEGEVEEYLGAITMVAYWYPNPGGAFRLKAGVGYLAYRIDDDEDAITSSGLGPQIGGGYEVRLSRTLSVDPYFNALVTLPTGKLHLNGDQQADAVSLALVQIGLAVTWH